MNCYRLPDYLRQIQDAAMDACDFTRDLTKEEFLTDKRTQRAVVMSLMIVGDAAGKVVDQFPEFAQAQPAVPWASMRGMRNRIAHGYLNINLEVVWATVQTALPELLAQLQSTPQFPQS